MPRAPTAAIAVLTPAQFAPWPDRLFDVEQALLMLTFVGVAGQVRPGRA